MTDIINIFWTAAVCLPVGFGLGWYVKGRGMSGIAIDLGNAKTTVSNAETTVVSDVKSL